MLPWLTPLPSLSLPVPFCKTRHARLCTWCPESMLGPRNQKPVAFSFGSPVPWPRETLTNFSHISVLGPSLLPSTPTCCPPITASGHPPQFAFPSPGFGRHTTLMLDPLLAMGAQARPSRHVPRISHVGTEVTPSAVDEGCSEHSVS